MIKEAGLTEYSGRCNAVRKHNGNLNVLRSQCQRNVVQKPRSLAAADAREYHGRPLCDWDSQVFSDLGVKNAVVCSLIKD
jgi:hypothetical protein